MVVIYWSAQYLNQYWSPQDMTGIDQKVFARLSVAIKTMEIVEELVKIGLNEVCNIQPTTPKETTITSVEYSLTATQVQNQCFFLQELLW